MLNHLPRDPRKIRWFPCEHIRILPEEGDKLAFLFSRKDSADGDQVAPVMTQRHLLRQCGIFLHALFFPGGETRVFGEAEVLGVSAFPGVAAAAALNICSTQKTPSLLSDLVVMTPMALSSLGHCMHSAMQP